VELVRVVGKGGKEAYDGMRCQLIDGRRIDVTGSIRVTDSQLVPDFSLIPQPLSLSLFLSFSLSPTIIHHQPHHTQHLLFQSRHFDRSYISSTEFPFLFLSDLLTFPHYTNQPTNQHYYIFLQIHSRNMSFGRRSSLYGLGGYGNYPYGQCVRVSNTRSINRRISI
jgi:hypothetical protein